jgi:hypothetical protein
MKRVKRRQIVNEARKQWYGGNPAEAGRMIFEYIPRKCRLTWAAGILELVCNYFPSVPHEVAAALDLARNHERWGEGEEGKWKEAHAVVVAAIGLSLASQDILLTSISTLAMNVGKVVYNARWYPAPFDHSAGWEIAKNLKEIAENVNNPEFMDRAWSTLSNEEYIKLRKPIMCNPNCGVCFANGLSPESEEA